MIGSVISSRCPVNPVESDIGNEAPGDPLVPGETMINYSKVQIRGVHQRSGRVT